MKRSLSSKPLLLLVLAVGLVSAAPLFAAEPPVPAPTPQRLPFLHTAGLDIVNEANERVALRGFNLGSWLLLEPWMVKLEGQQGVSAEKDIWDGLAKRFGEERMRAVVTAHRENFITETDMEDLHRLGVNFVRLPIWWRVLGDTAYDSNGWQYVDHLLDWCEARGMYVLLDLHGAPGGQSSGANILGERPDGTYWAADSGHRAEAARWWRTVAGRYAGRGVVAGYDLLNEAWGAPTFDALVAHMDEMYRAIREVDPRHMIFIEDGLQGYSRLPNPSQMNWQNVVYSFHFYPADGQVFAQRDLLGVRSAQLQYGIPVHIGEFNLYDADRGGISGMDRCLDVFNARGWAWTIWSYKMLENDGDYFWGMTGRTNVFLPWISLKESGYDEILDYFRSMATPHWGTDPLLRACVEQRLKQPAPAADADPAGSNQLAPADAVVLAHDAEHGLKMEWQWSPPDLGYWAPADSAAWRITTGVAGNYRLDLCYAAGGDGPIVEPYVDGLSHGKQPLAATGDWRSFQWASVPCGYLAAGRHVVRVACGGGKDFLNLREGRLIRDQTAVATTDVDHIELGPAEIAGFQRKGQICVEWQNTPPNIGHFNDGDAVVFHLNLPGAGQYLPSFSWSSPNGTEHLRIEVNGVIADTVDVTGTTDWHKYQWQRSDKPINLPAGDDELVVRAVDVDNSAGAGNLRALRMDLAVQSTKAGAEHPVEVAHE